MDFAEEMGHARNHIGLKMDEIAAGTVEGGEEAFGVRTESNSPTLLDLFHLLDPRSNDGERVQVEELVESVRMRDFVHVVQAKENVANKVEMLGTSARVDIEEGVAI